MIYFFRLNEWETSGRWENGGMPDAGGVADSVTRTEFRGEIISALLRVVDGQLWFTPRGWGEEWNFRISSCADIADDYDYFSYDGDAITMRSDLIRAKSPEVSSQHDALFLWRIVDEFYFASNGEAGLGEHIRWKWTDDFDADFFAQPSQFWKERVEIYEKSEAFCVVRRFQRATPEEKSDLIFEVSPRLRLIVEAAMRQCREAQRCFSAAQASSFCCGFHWAGEGLVLGLNDEKNQYRWHWPHEHCNENLMAWLQRILTLAANRFPARFLLPEIVRKHPIVKQVHSPQYQELYLVRVSLDYQSAHEKLEDLLLLREFLLEELSETEAEALLSDLQSEE